MHLKKAEKPSVLLILALTNAQQTTVFIYLAKTAYGTNRER